MSNSDDIYITMHKDDPEAFYAKIPYDKLPNIHRIGGKWMQSGKEWRFPLDDEIWEKFQKEFASEFTDGKVHKDIAFLLAFDKRHKDLKNFLSFKEIAMKDEPTDFGVDGVGLNGQNCLFNYQRWGVKCGLSVGDGFLIGDSMGLGKAEIVDNRLFTPEGRKRIGDIAIGDEVIGSNGRACKVTGVFPQGNKPVYRMTFSDGYSIECAEEHLWTVFTTLGASSVTITVKDMLDESKKIEHYGIGHNADKKYEYKTYYKCKNGDGHWQIPVVQPIQFNRNEELPIDSYLFGALLGDGHFMKHQIDVTENADDFEEMFGKYILQGYLNAHEKKSQNPNARVVAFQAGDIMDSLGLGCKKSWEKFIPDCYKYSSIEDRLELLHGLMDTDGHCQKRSKNRMNEDMFVATEYCSTSEHLVDDVAEIVQTLGGIARKHSKKTYYTKNGVRHECRTAYRLNIKLPSGMNPFKLKRKANACKTPLKYHVARVIKDIEYVGEKECVCIMVDAPDHLYVTEHCIVTHNTIQAIGIAKERMNRGEVHNCLIVCPASLKYNWKDELNRFTSDDALVIGHKCKNAQDREKQWIATGYPFKIVNYETVARDLYCEPKKKDNRISCAKAVLSSFDMVVFDECFDYDSKVLLADGTTEKIGRIVKERLCVNVMSYDWERMMFEAKQVVHYFDNGVKPVLLLSTNKGTVKVTCNHKYYRLDGTCVLAGELNVGDMIASFDNGILSNSYVLSIKQAGEEHTYNIEVEGNHNYICGGSLVSNCHMLKHHSSQRTLACRQFNAKYRIGLTGTPLDGRLEEIHSIFQILKPGLFVSKQKFMERYAEYDYFGAVKGYHHIKEVSDKIAPYYLRRLKEEVLKDLPPKIHKDMMVELSPQNMKAYKELVKKKNEITENASAMELVMRARQFLDFPEILGLHNSSDKYAVFKELLDELVKENNHKVIIFSQYTNTLHWLMKNLESEYKNILVIDGSVSPEERQEICKKFNSDSKYRIIIGTNALAVGLNLQSADDVINYTADFSPAIMKQREDRAYRCGVTHMVTVYDFVCMDTVDERVRNILTRKQTVNNALLGENVDSFEVGDMSAMEILSCL